jgi:hypothetical protein
MLHEQEIYAQASQLALLDAERREPKGLGRRDKDAARMRLEGQYTGWTSLRVGEVARLADQHRVTTVQTVKITHRKHRPGGVIRARAGMSDDSDHGGKI